jgi:hypothetical protein
MWKDKKFYIIIGVVVFAIIVGGVLGGLAIYRNNDDGRRSINITMPENMANNLQNAANRFKSTDLNTVFDNYLDKLVKDGKITQEQADQFKDWWQERPDIPGIFAASSNSTFSFGAMRNGNPDFNFGFRGYWSK